MTTLESYLSFTFTEELQSARDTDLFAWIQTTQGVRNLFIARPPDFTPLQVTNWIDDDGLCLSQLQVADDGSALLVVRGEGKITRATTQTRPPMCFP